MDREEAIRRIKAWNLDSDDMEVLAVVIPELAESEDERMYARVTGRYTRFEKYYLRALGETEANKVLKQCEEEELWIKNLLEKQKDLDKMIVVSPEVWDKAIADAYENGKKDNEKQKEQKTAEWNDSDMKEARNNLISVCRDWERGEKTTLLPVVAVRARYFLEHLTEPKCAVWSKEDENKIERLAFLVSVAEEKEMISPSESIDLRNFIKSLRPQQKQEWSEEDDNIYNKALDAIYYKDINDKDEVVDALKALCDLISRKRKVIPPYARWKPSEKQMKALKEVAYNIVGTGTETDVHLVQLYEQLKRL